MATGDKRRSEELLVETERLQSRVLELEQRERSQLATGDDSARRENLYRTVFENTGTATIVIEEDTTISLCNGEFERLSGYSRMEINGKKRWTEFVSPDDVSPMLAQHALRREDPHRALRTYEFRFIGRDGTVRFIDLVIDIVKGTSQSVASLRDITERKRVEKDLRQTLDRLTTNMETTVQVLVLAAESRDPYTAGHQRRTTQLACAIARELGLPDGQTEAIRMAGQIHDIGKISVPSEILSKASALSPMEYELIKAHATSGAEILKNVESPGPLSEIVRQHHERVNGSGYPRGLTGDEMLIEARILAVADVVEAMVSHRPYRPAFAAETALRHIEECRGILYDGPVVDACLRLFREKDFRFDGP